MFSIFHMAKFAESHPNIPAETTRAIEYNGIKTKMDNRKSVLSISKPDLIVSQGVIKDLNTSWGANEAAIKAGNEVTINAALNTLFGTIGAVATGGASVVATVAVSGPAFITAAKTYSSAAKTDNARLKRSVYLNAFSVALAGHEAAVAWQKSIHDEYTDLYVNQYLRMEVEHDGGLHTQGASGIDGPFTKEQLYSSIHKISITYDAEGKMVIGEYVRGIHQKEDGYYHLIQDYYGNNRLGSTDHTMSTHLHWDQVDIPELPSDKACYGSSTCQVNFPTYYDAWYSHLEKCGTAINAITAAWNVAKQIEAQIALGPNNPSFDSSLEETYPTTYKYISNGAAVRHAWTSALVVILGNRTVDEGCGRSYYNCHERHNDLHTNRDCIGNSIDDDEEANAGGSLHACNIHDASDSGDHSSTWLCNESPCSNRQVPYCLAMCPYTGSHGTATTPMHVCDVHELWQSGDHSSTWLCNESPCSNRQVPYCLALCPETSSHGTTTITGGDEDTSGDEDALAACSVHPASASGDHSMQASCSYADRFGDSCAITNFYACDNHVHFINTALLMGACGRHWVPSRLLSAHSLQASCSTINSNGDSCTVTSFYACYNHTHTYPAP